MLRQAKLSLCKMLLQIKLSGSRCYAKVNSPGARWCTKLHFWCKNWHFNTQTANWFICSAPIDPPPSLDRRVTVQVGAIWLLVYYTSVHNQSRSRTWRMSDGIFSESRKMPESGGSPTLKPRRLFTKRKLKKVTWNTIFPKTFVCKREFFADTYL